MGATQPLTSPEGSSVEVRMTAKADGAEISQRLSKIETAISRRKTIEFTYYTIERDATEKRKVDPFHLVYRGGQFYLIGHSHERDAVRVFRLSRIKGKVSYASKAEHDFTAPEDFDRRDYARRSEWQLGEIKGPPRSSCASASPGWSSATTAAMASCATRASATRPGQGTVFETEYASSRQLVAWVLHWRQNATVLDPRSWPRGRRAAGAAARAPRGRVPDRAVEGLLPAPMQRVGRGSNGRSESSIRPERFARLVTLAGMLIEAAKGTDRLRVAEVRDNSTSPRRSCATTSIC